MGNTISTQTNTDSNNDNEGASPRCNIFCSSFLSSKKVKKSWRKEFRISCRTLEPEYDWPEILCDLLSELKDRTPEIAFKNEAMNYVHMKKEMENNKNNQTNPILLQKETTDLFLKEEDEEKKGNHEQTSQEKSFENFISFQNMQKKQQKLPCPSTKEIQIEDSGCLIERGVSSINKETHDKCNTSSLNASASNQLQVQSYPHTFIIYKNFSILETSDRSLSKFSDKKLWLKDKTMIAVQKYRNLASLIEKHLLEQKHPLCLIKNEYIQYFIRLNQKLTMTKENKPYTNDAIHKEIKYMTRDVKSFVWVFKEAINNFYDLESVSKKFRTSEFDLFSDYNMINFIYSLIFTDEVYSIFMESLITAEKYKEILYNRNLELLKNSPPEKFLVQEKFCLNKRTAEFFSRIYPEISNFISFENSCAKQTPEKEVKTKKLNYIELQTRIFPHLLMNSFNKNEFLNKSERNSRKSNENKKNEKPYNEAIDLLKNLQFMKSPAHKIKIITQAFDLIEESIMEHYADHGYDEKYIVMEPEDLISIIVYIMSQLPLSHMVTHCNFIELFFNETNLNSKSACYLYSLKTGIEYILNSIDEND